MSLENHSLLRFEGFTINLAERTLWRDGEPVALAPKVMEMLCVFVENQGRLLPKEELLNRLWADTFVEERNLTQNVFTLRKALGEGESGRKLIDTVPRRGYRFVAEVHPVEIFERLHVSHSKQTRISAQGHVDPRDLTNAVTSIMRSADDDAVPERNPKPAVAEMTGRSRVRIYIGVVGIMSLCLFLWSWKSGLAPSVDSQPMPDRPILSFERLTDSGQVFFPSMSPDEQFFAYVRIDSGLYSIELQNLATGSKTVVVGPSEKELGRPKFSVDGNYIFYRETESRGDSGSVFRVPILGGTPRIIGGGVLSNAAVSPDGVWLSYIRANPSIDGQELVICRSSDGGDARVIAARTGPLSFQVWGFTPIWSPDGEHVLVRLLASPSLDEPDARGEGFGMMSVKDGTFEKLKTPEWAHILQAEWMPDARSILFLAKEKASEPFQIWKVDYPSGALTRITNDSHDYRYLNVASDGRSLLATQERNFLNLWTIPVDDPTGSRQLTFSTELEHGQWGISWTPDGKHLVYALTESYSDINIWKLNVDSLESRQLTFDSHRSSKYPRVTPEGTVIFTSNRESGTHVWSMDLNGSGIRQITSGLDKSFSNISADGRWLTYATPPERPQTLWKKSLADEANDVKITDGAAGSNSPSPDGKRIVVSYRSEGNDGRLIYRYGVMPLDQPGSPEDLGFNPFYGAIAWKQDGQGFYYLKDFGESLTNVWFYDLQTKTHRAVTDFGDQMFSLSLSPDGRTLATARGQTISNVVRIEGY